MGFAYMLAKREVEAHVRARRSMSRLRMNAGEKEQKLYCALGFGAWLFEWGTEACGDRCASVGRGQERLVEAHARALLKGRVGKAIAKLGSAGESVRSAV